MSYIENKIKELEANLAKLKVIAETERQTTNIHNTILGMYGTTLLSVLKRGICIQCPTDNIAYCYFRSVILSTDMWEMVSNIKYDGEQYYFVVKQYIGDYTPMFHIYVEPFKVDGKLVYLRITHITTRSFHGTIEVIAQWKWDTPPISAGSPNHSSRASIASS